MKETSLFGLLIGLCILSIIAGFAIFQQVSPFSPENLEVTNYSFIFHENGTLLETYQYSIAQPDSVMILTRSWNTPLSLTSLNETYVQVLGIGTPPGSVGFFKDGDGNTTLYGGTIKDEQFVTGLSRLKNLVGVVNRSRFSNGATTVGYLFRVFPLIKFDDEYVDLNLFISDNHPRFRNVNLTLAGANITEVHARPPNLKVTKINEGFLVTGEVLADEELGIDILYNHDVLKSLPGFAIYTPGVYDRVHTSYPFYNGIPSPLATALLYTGILWLIALPFIFTVIYRRYGKEKPANVQEFVSITPNKSLKPWQVNLIFKNDAVDFDEDGLTATLLDLHRRGCIDIKAKEGGEEFLINVLNDQDLDSYEERVVNLIRTIAGGDEFDTRTLYSLAIESVRNMESEKRILHHKQSFEELTRWTSETLIVQYIFKGREHITPLLLVSAVGFSLTVILLILIPVLVSPEISAMIFWSCALAETIFAYLMPETLFGRWKEDSYREKLEWDGFGRFLSDRDMVRKYSPNDPLIWAEWLAYGTALGVGEKLEEAIRELTINLPDDLHLPKKISQIFLPLKEYDPSSG